MKIKLYNDNPGETLNELGLEYDKRILAALAPIYNDAVSAKICLRELNDLIIDISSFQRSQETILYASRERKRNQIITEL